MKNQLLRQVIRFPNPGQIFPGRRGGGKRYIVDSRGVGIRPKLRRQIVECLAEKAARAPSFDVVVGVATSGIIWAAWLAERLDLPYATVLKEPRRSGMQRQVEGDVRDQNLILVDNVVASGTSICSAVRAVRQVGGYPVAVMSLVGNSAVNLNMPFYSVWERAEVDRLATRILNFNHSFQGD